MVGVKTWFRCLIIILTGSTRMCWTNLYVCLVAASFTHAQWDNSDRNPSNPDPSRRVGWEQSFDEMFFGTFQFVRDRGQPVLAVMGFEVDIILPSLLICPCGNGVFFREERPGRLLS